MPPARSNRRTFLRQGLTAGAAGWTLTNTPVAKASPAPTQPAAAVPRVAPAVLSEYTAQTHRRRLENIRTCEQSIRNCLRKHLVTDYLPGQCSYNLGEYPALKPWNPDDWDETELDRLRNDGVQLIQIHEEWNDPLRLFGQDKLSPVNPAGFHRFVDMVHRRGMKLIAYASTGFFMRPDKDFRPEWAGPDDLIEFDYDYALCSPASPGWRAFILPRLVRLLDEYGLDGFYDDLGYFKPGGKLPVAADQVLAFNETAENDGALADLLSLIYAETKRRGGVLKVHYGAVSRPRTDFKVYDYIWVGECVENSDALRAAVKNHPPYVVPCLDMSRAKIANEDELYLQSIPYMQFPLLLAGRPFTGERGAVPGVHYQPEATDFWTRHAGDIRRHYQAHPEGPHAYGWWDSVPGRPEARPTHARWLKQYLPLVEEGTWAYLELADSDFFSAPLPANVVASAFANRDLYLVLANYNPTPVQVATRWAWTPTGDKPGPSSQSWELEGRSLRIVRSVGGTNSATAPAP
jgi:hypothetical protein